MNTMIVKPVEAPRRARGIRPFDFADLLRMLKIEKGANAERGHKSSSIFHIFTSSLLKYFKCLWQLFEDTA